MAPRVLILGGIGFIGRHLVEYLLSNNLVDYVRVCDKAIQATAYLSAAHKKAFEDARVDFKQANLSSPAGIEKAFEGQQFDYVINLAAETKYGQGAEVYEEKVYQLSVALGKEAAKRNVKVFVELSTAQKASTEEAKLKPWTHIAAAKAKVENELQKILGLNLVILRPAIVYGKGDQLGITPRLIVGAVYRKLGEEMKLLWTKDLKINTVHVSDTVYINCLHKVRAIWWVCATTAEKGGRKTPVVAGTPEIYNLVDKNETDQGKVNALIEKIFGIETGFQGTIISSFAKLNLDSVTEDVNDKHLQPWSDLCKAGNVTNTPLTPYLDKELLKDNALCADGSKIEKTLGFTYAVPQMTVELLREVIDDFVALNIWPQGTTK